MGTLVDAGVDLDARDDRGWTALMRSAAHSSDPGVVGALLSLGADLSLQDDAGQTALDLMRDNPDLKDTHVYWRLRELATGRTLHISPAAAASLTVAEVQEAVTDGAPIGRLLWEVACYNRDAAVTRALLAAGAPTNYRDRYGWTASMRAAAVNPNPDVVQEMLNAGAELQVAYAYEPTPECVHPNPEYRDAIGLVYVLSEQYQDQAIRGGEPAFLLAAAYNENPAVLQVLIDAGAEVDRGRRAHSIRRSNRTHARGGDQPQSRNGPDLDRGRSRSARCRRECTNRTRLPRWWWPDGPDGRRRVQSQPGGVTSAVGRRGRCGCGRGRRLDGTDGGRSRRPARSERWRSSRVEPLDSCPQIWRRVMTTGRRPDYFRVRSWAQSRAKMV